LNIKTGKSEEVKEKTLQQLIDLGFLVPSTVDEKEIVKLKMNSLKYTPLQMGIFVSLTSACNLKCPYCYQSMRNDTKYLTVEKWKVLYKYITKHQDIVKALAIALFGGEPLMNYDIAKEICKDVKKLRVNGIHTSIALVTNGTLFTKEVGEELSDYLENVQITIDGMQGEHDKLRPLPNGKSSFEIIIKNLIDNIDLYKDRIVLRSNITEENIESVKTLLKYLKEEVGIMNKIKEVDFRYIYPSQNDIFDGAIYRLDSHVSKMLLEMYKYATELGYKIANPLLSVAPCMASHAFSFAVDENLNVYKCGGFLYSTPDGYISPDGKLVITNPRWYKLINFEPVCVNTCKFAPVCYGGCKWMGIMNNFKGTCNIEHFKDLKEFLRIYVNSNYKRQLEVMQ
jgi:uncharacterized protein